jgi:hypothetical protein
MLLSLAPMLLPMMLWNKHFPMDFFSVALRINDIKQSIFVMEAERVLCNVGTEIET